MSVFDEDFASSQTGNQIAQLIDPINLSGNRVTANKTKSKKQQSITTTRKSTPMKFNMGGQEVTLYAYGPEQKQIDSYEEGSAPQKPAGDLENIGISEIIKLIGAI